MNGVKPLARVLYLISRIIGAGYFLTAVYGALCLVTGWATTPYGDGKYLHINYPFTNRPFLNVDNNASYIIFSFLLLLTLYSAFFWLAGGVFKVFFQPKLFTKGNVVHLKRFYLLNLIAPLTATLIASAFVPVESMVWGLVIVHLFLGIFTYFLAAIFKQGLNLQNEQDLFI